MSAHTDALRGIRAFGPEHFAHLEGLIEERDQLLIALQGLREQLRAHIKMDVKKHYSLMFADAQAGTAMHKALISEVVADDEGAV